MTIMKSGKRVKIVICVGSSCHLKGSKAVVEAVQKEISDRGLQEKVDVCGAFCLKHCMEGVCVMVDDAVYSLQPNDVNRFFDAHILPLLYEDRKER